MSADSVSVELNIILQKLDEILQTMKILTDDYQSPITISELPLKYPDNDNLVILENFLIASHQTIAKSMQKLEQFGKTIGFQSQPVIIKIYGNLREVLPDLNRIKISIR